MRLPTATTLPSNLPRRAQRWLSGLAFVAGLTLPAFGQLIYQEDFNTDGAGTRYTVLGGDVVEDPTGPPINNADQKGPIYWARNADVSYVGNPTIPARRAIFTWRTSATPGATADLLDLYASTVNWMLDGKANATIVVNPNVASIQELANRLTAAGHTVVDDNTATPDSQLTQDLFIHGPGATSPSRFVVVPKPVIVINEPDYDDMLVGSIGSLATFDPGDVTISAEGHPAAGGKTGSFEGFTNAQPFGLVGSFLPPGATTLATVTRIIPPAVNSLADVDAMIAGTKQHEKTSATVAAVDFDDASAGDWTANNPIPGGYAGNWGLQVTGTLNVPEAGTFRFAIGSDDGARLQIDLDRNGIDPNDPTDDLVMEDPGPHGHQLSYADVTFGASGTYAFEIRAYNSGGGGDLEAWVSNVAVPVPDDDVANGYYDVLGSPSVFSIITLQGSANVTAYRAVGPDVEDRAPLIVLLNGPNDTPPGAFYDGGPFSNYEGAGFFAGSGLNKFNPAYPANGSYDAVRLNPVNVAGRSNVKITVSLGATVVDFETSDLLDIVAYPNGTGSTPVTLGHFRGVQNAVQPWLADELSNFNRRLTRQLADFVFDAPAGAANLVVEIRAATTWWTEIVAFDNIRISEGLLTPSLVLESSADVASGYSADAGAVVDATAKTITLPLPTSPRFFRATGQNVTLGPVTLEGGNLVIGYQ